MRGTIHFLLFLGNQDPGWNDPPIFAYDKATAIQTAAANKKGISLNKRVAFPISGKIESTQAGLSTNLDLAKPPMMQIPSASSPIPTLKNESELSPKQDMDSFGKDMLNEVLQNLSLHTINDEEIVKRIRVMEKMWMENKLDENVCRKILELSKGRFSKFLYYFFLIKFLSKICS